MGRGCDWDGANGGVSGMTGEIQFLDLSSDFKGISLMIIHLAVCFFACHLLHYILLLSFKNKKEKTKRKGKSVKKNNRRV